MKMLDKTGKVIVRFPPETEAITPFSEGLATFVIASKWGFLDTNGTVVIEPSYQLKDTPDANRPAVSLYEMGAFTQDYEYVEGLGDLDECNGRMGITPEFPEGIYHYYATDGFPFLQRCVKGTP